MVTDLLLLVPALVVVAAPGTALLFALGWARPFHVAALAPAATVGVALAVSTVCGLLGLRFGLVSLAVVTLLLVALGLPRVLRDRRRRSGEVVRRRRVLVGRQRWAVLTGVVLLAVATGYGAWSWLAGLGWSLHTEPQEHDTIVHTVLTAYIQHTGEAAPWELLPVDLLDGDPVQFYPAGFHLLAAVVGAIAGDPVAGLNAVTVVLLVGGLVASVGSLAYLAARQARLGRGGGLLAAGVAAAVAVGLYRPVFALAHDGGILANAASLVLTPGVLAGLLALERRSWGLAVVSGVSLAGLLALHPSAAVSVGVTLLAWWVGAALLRGGLRRIGAQLLPLVLVGGVTAVVALPLVLQVVGVGGKVTAFAPDIAPHELDTALAKTLLMRYDGYSPFHQELYQVAAGVVILFGAAAVAVTVRAWGALTAWLAWVAVTVAAFVSPGEGPEAVITGFYYHAQLRVWSHVSLLGAVLAGVGAVLGTALLVRLVRRLPVARPLPTWATVTGVVLVLAGGYLLGPGVEYARTDEYMVASRYARPDFVRVSEDDKRAAEWLSRRVRPGERVLNSANDGSVHLYVEYGIPVVNVSSIGTEQAPYTVRLLSGFNRYPEDPEIRRILLEQNVGWVYVDSAAPLIGSGGATWIEGPLYDLAPGLQDLDGLPGLELVFRSGTVSVYRLDLDRISQM